MIVLDNSGAFPFYAACASGNVEVLDWLLLHGMPTSEMTRTGKWDLYRMISILII